MRIAVIKSEGCIASNIDYADNICKILDKSRFRYDILDFRQDTKLDVLGHDAFIITGGSVSADSTIPWMRRAIATVEKLCQRAHDGHAMLMGVCLGSQMIANSYAGRHMNQACAKGMEFGFQRVSETRNNKTLLAFEFHYEEISEKFLRLEQVEHLYWNNHSKVQGYRIGENIIASQFHPEIPPSMLAGIISYQSDVIKQYCNLDVDIKNHSTIAGERHEDFFLDPLHSFFSY